MQDNAHTARSSTYLVWEPPGHRISILLSLGLLDSFRARVLDAGRPDGEAGGILLGRFDRTNPERPIITVEDCDLVECDHRRGPAYVLDLAGVRRLEKRLRHWRQRNHPLLTPVGFVRTHARTGLYLAAADFSLARDYFSNPDAVFLLVRPGPEPVGGVFFWEDGDIHSQSSYLPFPFDSAALEASGASLLRTAPSVEPARPVEVVQPLNALPPARSPGRKTPVWAIASTLLILLLPWVWLAWHRHSVAARAKGFRLDIARSGRVITLIWDREAAAIRDADVGVLSITDGSLTRQMDFNPGQLQRGYAMYVPVAGDVTFRLEVRNRRGRSAESIRSVTPAAGAVPGVVTEPAAAGLAPQPVAPATRPAPQREPDAEPVVFEPAASHAPGSAAAPAPKQAENKTGSADRDKTQGSEEPRPFETGMATAPRLPAPPVAEPPAAQPPPKPVNRPAVRPPVPPSSVAIAYQAPRESVLKRAIDRVPGLRLFQHGSYKEGQEFVPARPVRPFRPRIPFALAEDLPGEWRVDLAASIDKNGRLTSTELLSPQADSRLTELAESALDRWEFEPARIDGHDVSSKLIVTFRFRNPPQRVQASASP